MCASLVQLFTRLSAFSRSLLPLLPAEVVPASKDKKKAKDGEEDDNISCHHQATGTPLDL